MTEETELPMWTVTINPSDYPGRIVARKWLISREGYRVTADVVVRDNINEMRDQLRDKGMQICISRSPGDDPVIAETWV